MIPGIVLNFPPPSPQISWSSLTPLPFIHHLKIIETRLASFKVIRAFIKCAVIFLFIKKYLFKNLKLKPSFQSHKNASLFSSFWKLKNQKLSPSEFNIISCLAAKTLPGKKTSFYAMKHFLKTSIILKSATSCLFLSSLQGNSTTACKWKDPSLYQPINAL